MDGEESADIAGFSGRPAFPEGNAQAINFWRSAYFLIEISQPFAKVLPGLCMRSPLNAPRASRFCSAARERARINLSILKRLIALDGLFPKLQPRGKEPPVGKELFK
jgi:hypothetical protein